MTHGKWEVPAARSKYSRTSVARTLMARLPRLFQTRSLVPKKNPIAADNIIIGII